MQYTVKLTDEFKKKATKFLKLHPDMTDRYKKTIRLLQENPHYPALRLHKLQGNRSEYYSVSINISYRVILDFVICDNEIIPVDIGSHDEVY